MQIANKPSVMRASALLLMPLLLLSVIGCATKSAGLHVEPPLIPPLPESARQQKRSVPYSTRVLHDIESWSEMLRTTEAEASPASSATTR